VTGSKPARARVVIVQGGRVALIKRVRAGRTYYLFPGGGVEQGETPEQAAIREAHEELGVEVELGEPRYEEDFDRSRFVYFDALIVGGEFGTGLWPDHAERDAGARERSGTHEPVWVPLDELDGLDIRPKALVELLGA
jgi:8-oxo-dGTP pyrophosphatase MutT (NUDIX family)